MDAKSRHTDMYGKHNAIINVTDRQTDTLYILTYRSQNTERQTHAAGI